MRARESRDQSLLEYYKKYNKIFKKVVRQAKRISNGKYIVDSQCKSKATWQVVKSELGLNVRKYSDITEIIVQGDKPVSNPAEIAKHFNRFFINVVDELGVKSISGGAADLCDLGGLSIDTLFDFQPVSISRIVTVIDSFPNKNLWDEMKFLLVSSKLVKSI